MSVLGPAERRLLLSVLDVRAATEPVATQPDDLDWFSLVEVATEAKILPTLAQRVLLEPSMLPDPGLGELLRDSVHEAAVYNTRILAELSRTVSILDRVGIEHVVLKGAVLLCRHYPRIEMRHTVDFDLLIDPQRFDEALCLLQQTGYKLAPEAMRLAPDGRTVAEAWAPNEHAHAPLKGPSGANVDLHHRVPTAAYSASGGFAGWRARARAQQVHGVTLWMCATDDLVLHLCEHFAIQHMAEPTDVPRLLCDLRAIFADEPPWSRLSTGPWKQEVAVSLARHLYDAAFDGAAAGDALGRLLRRVAVADPGITPLLSEISNLRGHATRVPFDILNRPRYALRTWLPTRSYMAEHYRIDLRSPKMISHYLSRLLLAPIRPLWPRR